MYNKLLQRQLKRHFKDVEIPEQFKGLLQAISESYEHYESDRNLLERSLEVSSNELNDANSKIKEAYAQIEEKNKDITDSIRYAKRIQEAILPGVLVLREYFSDSFVLFKPRDIVSGDFYWIETTRDKMIFAAVDCTGHGVPGAFMSMIGNSLLNEIVNEKQITSPPEILIRLRKGVIQALRQNESGHESKDGMDIALCAVDYNDNTIEFAGAFNPFWMIRNNELHEIRGDKFPIGNYIEGQMPDFSGHKMPLQKGDTIYVFSDGYSDQFGGANGKKFKASQLKQLLLNNQALSMKEQRALLENTHLEWKGTQEQVDDILVIGVRV